MKITISVDGEHQVARLPDERDPEPGRRAEAAVLEPGRDRQRPEHQCDGGLPDELRPAAQAEAALARDLDVVVEEAHGAEPHEQEDQQEGGGARGVARRERGHEVGEDRGEDDHQAAHGGRAALGVVRGGAVVTDQLSVATLGEHTDRVARPDEGEDEGQGAGQQDRSQRTGSSPCGRSVLVLGLLVDEHVDDPFELGAPRRLDQHHVGTRHILAQPLPGLGGGVDVACPAVLAAHLHERVVEPLGARTDHQHDVDPEPVGEEPDLAVLLDALGAELAHLPQHRDRASRRSPSGRGSPGRRASSRGWRCRRR